MRIETKEISPVQVIRDMVNLVHLTFEQIAIQTGLTEREIKQIYKKGVIPVFDKKMKILNTFKEQWFKLKGN